MIDKDKPPETPYLRSIRLKTAFDVNRLLARTINQVLRDQMTESKAGKIGYLCNIMLKSFEVTEFEKRIETLEEAVRERKRNESG